MTKSIPALLLLLSLPFTVPAQEVPAPGTQTIRGHVFDSESHYPVIAASIAVQGAVPPITATSDEEGRFVLKAVPLGRQVISVAAFTYKPMTTAPLEVMSGKELVVDLDLEPSVSELKEVEVRKDAGERERANNEMAVMSARSFDSELAARFAGGRNDPARMATNFAGVSGANDGRNDIIIRGNSPSGLLWRMEGIDIPSPNHFSSFGSTGGPVSMLNNNVLAKSDFLTSAFPAMYGNAISGVFDIALRNGNDQKHEFLGQIGFNGFEFGAEGPINKATHSSYLVNYRYSTLEAFKQLGLQFGTGDAVPKYQDLSFKINLPTKKAGRFALFGFGGTSSIDLLGSETDFSKKNENELYGNETQDIFNSGRTGMIGLSHTFFFNERTSYKLILAASEQRDRTDVDSLTWSTGSGEDVHLLGRQQAFNTLNHQTALTAHLLLRSKIDGRNTVQTGAIVTRYDGSFFRRYFRQQGTIAYWDTLGNGDGTYLLAQAYVTWKHHFSEAVYSTFGAHAQYHDLSNDRSLEPRAALCWRPGDRSEWTVAYGLHAQTQLAPVYFVTTPSGIPTTNRDLGFTRSHHIAIGHVQRFGRLWSLKTEAYYQHLFDVPIEDAPTNFSMLNAGADFAPPDEDGLVNSGLGRNYGLEITGERTFDKGLYALMTASFFKSEYRGGDGVWRSTVFDGGYVFNALAGKEFKVGHGNNVIAADVKATWAGGRRYTPIDLETSLLNGRTVYFEDRAFSSQYPAYFRADVKVMYRVQRKKSTHEFGIDLQNVSGNRNIYDRHFDERTGKIVTEYQIGFFPIPQYRILF